MDLATPIKSAFKVKSFTDLYAWREAHALVLSIYKTAQLFPPEEKFGLKSQICRAAVSISSNIAEGFSRKTIKEKRQFYTTALASLTEIQNQLLIARDLHFVNNETFTRVAEQSVKTGKLINGIIKSAQGHEK